MKIKGAIFDMDGTILDSLMFWEHLWKRIGEKYMNCVDFKPDEDVDKKVRTMIYADAMAYFKNYYNVPVDIAEFIDFTSNGIADFYKKVVTPKAGVKTIFEYLKKKNIKFCLASATAMSEIKLALKHHDLLHYFDFVLSCADIGVGKDQPDIYFRAMSLMELEANEICVFEDSYIALETAKRSGFQTVGVYDRYAFGQERVRNSSDIYLGGNQTFESLIGVIHT